MPGTKMPSPTSESAASTIVVVSSMVTGCSIERGDHQGAAASQLPSQRGIAGLLNVQDLIRPAVQIERRAPSPPDAVQDYGDLTADGDLCLFMPIHFASLIPQACGLDSRYIDK
jgi:hypothetical protein